MSPGRSRHCDRSLRLPGVRNSSAASPSESGRQIPWRYRDGRGGRSSSDPPVGSHLLVRRLLLVRHAATAATRAAAFPADEPLDERGAAAAATLADRLPLAASASPGAGGGGAWPADRLPLAASASPGEPGAGGAWPADHLPLAASASPGAGGASRADRLPPLVSKPLGDGGAPVPGRPRSRCDLLCSPALRCVQTAAAAGLSPPRVEPLLAECDFGAWAGRSLADVHEADAGAWMTDPAAAPARRRVAARVRGPRRRLARRAGAPRRPRGRDHARRRRQGRGRPRARRAARGLLADRRQPALDHRAARARRPLDGHARELRVE